jgi:hypothetical protein
MIKIEVDESFAYDMLAIAQIKESKLSNDITCGNVTRILLEIQDQVGPVLHLNVVASKEYADLKDANLALFNIFDEIKRPDKNECFDIKADNLNYRRFECKKALQAKFFPRSAITEVKLGY